MTILIACLLIVLCIIVHAVATSIAINISKLHSNYRWKRTVNLFWISIIVLIMFFASVMESGMWATAYYVSGAISNYQDALYFSIVTFTTLGYGDITLTDDWRLLASFEAATGIIIFGWSTAVVMVVVQHIFFKKN